LWNWQRPKRCFNIQFNIAPVTSAASYLEKNASSPQQLQVWKPNQLQATAKNTLKENASQSPITSVAELKTTSCLLRAHYKTNCKRSEF
jgi:hypothetical protein